MVDQRFDHIDSGTLSATGARAYLRRPSVTCTQLPQTPPSAHGRIVVARPSTSGRSEAPCVRCAGVTPNTSTSVAWRSTLVVSASHVPPPLDARPVDEQRHVAQRLVLRHPGLAPDVLPAAHVAQVVAVVGAHDHGRVVPQPAVVERRHHLAEPVVDHRQLGAVVGPDVAGLGAVEITPRDTPADHVRRPDDQVAVPRLVLVAAEPRRRRVEGLVRVELVDEEQEAVVLRRGAAQPVGPPRPSCAGPGSRPRRGRTCASGRRPGRPRRRRPARTARTTRRRGPAAPACRPTTCRRGCATGRPRGPARSPRRRSRCGSSRRRSRTGAGGR